MSSHLDTIYSLLRADEVKTFPSIHMPPPKPKPIVSSSSSSSSTSSDKQQSKFLRKRRRHKIKFTLPSITDESPRDNEKAGGISKAASAPIIKGAKAPTMSEAAKKAGHDGRNILTGFNSSNLQFDPVERETLSPELLQTIQQSSNQVSSKLTATRLATINLGASLGSNSSHGYTPDDAVSIPYSSSSKGFTSRKNDKIMAELRNYLLLMDEYSLHNFIIYDGRTLRDTPEFQSLRQTYVHSWGGMTYIIEQLEKFVAKYNIKMAVIDGTKVFDLAQLNLPYYEKNDLMSCIANSEQIKPQVSAALTDAGINQLTKAVVKIQSLIRKFLARRRMIVLRGRWLSIIKIQAHFRRRKFRKFMNSLAKSNRAVIDDKWRLNKEKLQKWWQSVPEYASGTGETVSLFPASEEDQAAMAPMIPTRKRLLIHVPSISTAEYIRLHMNHLQVIQNTHISVLYQLIDPDVHILYISPIQMTADEHIYIEKFLATMGIPTIPKRLHFIVPELLDRLPHHISLAQLLLCSTGALNKIKFYLNRIPNAIFVPTNISWVEKRLVDFLNVPMISSEPLVTVTLHSRSFLKKHFMEASVNIPLGAHDVHSSDDLYIALSRLIATNLDIKRWILKMNYDANNESFAYIDVEKLSVLHSLRKEQAKLIAENRNNLLSWYSRPVQFSVRQRIMLTLKNEMSKKIRICHEEIYVNWENYLKFVQQHGAVIEAEPVEKLGYVDGLCFIDPFGSIQYCGGCDSICDDNYQVQSVVLPATLSPPAALEGATKVIAANLHAKFEVIGYLTVRFVAFWDGLDNIPRLWALGVHIGMTPAFNTLGNLAVLHDPYINLPKSIIPMDIPTGRHVITIPLAVHGPLVGTRDDVFFKLCKMRGISFDVRKKTGVLFFLIDAVVGGAISLMVIASSRRKVLEIAHYTLSTIIQQYGRADIEEGKSWQQITSIASTLRQLIRNDDKK